MAQQVSSVSSRSTKPWIAFRALFGLLASACLAAGAQAQSAPTRDPDKIKGGTYSVDPNHTQIGWRVSHLGLTNYAGTFSNASGTLELDPKNTAISKLSVKIPVGSVETTSSKLTDELKGAQWLDAGSYPDMTFVSTKVKPVGKDKAKVTGDLTLHGISQPVTLDVALIGAGMNPIAKKYTVGFEVTGLLKRSDFGVKAYVPYIGDEMHLTIAGAFERQD